ncbi:hypothetical protein SAMN05216474_1178 [Lishizhenia tianjinensis]|uniref:Lipoprotein n=1 Tax=Lishizhenia tianjinensis TaxID=477690 RepID=A0A1I6YUQ0_9FLAO|nr:hypothetical protein [Lishizhenia tianjinensis]SFT53961.1 hypothetical protein SAMN05216474_1178 [Lishizhenia tianjinensis]
MKIIFLSTLFLLGSALSACKKNGVEQTPPPSNISSLQAIKNIVSKNIISKKDYTLPQGSFVLEETANSFYLCELALFCLGEVKVDNSCRSRRFGPNEKFPYIKEIEYTEEYLDISIGVIEKCGSDFICDAAFEENNLNLIYHQYSSLAFCNCEHTIHYCFYIDNQNRLGDEPEIESISVNGEPLMVDLQHIKQKGKNIGN